METEDGNEDVCGACTDIGDLICCESCPAAYHADCAGYGKKQDHCRPVHSVRSQKPHLCLPLQLTHKRSQQEIGTAGPAAFSSSVAFRSQAQGSDTVLITATGVWHLAFCLTSGVLCSFVRSLGALCT